MKQIFTSSHWHGQVKWRTKIHLDNAYQHSATFIHNSNVICISPVDTRTSAFRKKLSQNSLKLFIYWTNVAMYFLCKTKNTFFFRECLNKIWQSDLQLVCVLQQKKRGKGDGRNKENIIEDVRDGEDEDKSPEPPVEKKNVCYEIKESDVMGR